MPGKILRSAFRNRAFFRGLSGLIGFSAAVGSDGVLTPSRTAAIYRNQVSNLCQYLGGKGCTSPLTSVYAAVCHCRDATLRTFAPDAVGGHVNAYCSVPVSFASPYVVPLGIAAAWFAGSLVSRHLASRSADLGGAFGCYPYCMLISRHYRSLCISLFASPAWQP